MKIPAPAFNSNQSHQFLNSKFWPSWNLKNQKKKTKQNPLIFTWYRIWFIGIFAFYIDRIVKIQCVLIVISLAGECVLKLLCCWFTETIGNFRTFDIRSKSFVVRRGSHITQHFGQISRRHSFTIESTTWFFGRCCLNGEA